MANKKNSTNTIIGVSNLKRPTAPPVYRPQSQRMAAQPKTAFAPAKPAFTASNVKHPAAPPAYRPQPTPKVAQTKMASGNVNLKPPVVPSVYRSEARKIVQQQPKSNALPTPRVPGQAPFGVAKQGKKNPMRNRVAAASPHPPSRLVQLAEDNRLHLETTMTSQFKLSFPFGFVDLNCGWYCEMAAIDYWRKKLHLQLPDEILPKTTVLAFHPGKEGSAFVNRHNTPNTVQAWKTLIKDNGPIVASGKLGPVAGPMRISHFVLVVGADVAKGVLILQDPLSASETYEGRFEGIKDDFNATVYSIDTGKLASQDTRLRI